MKIKTAYKTIAVVIFTIPQLFAQSPDAGSILSWPDCVSLALRNNPFLASSRHSLEASKSSYYGSYNSLMPQVSLSHSYSDSSSSLPGSANWQTAGSARLNIFNKSQITSIKTSQAFFSQSEISLRQASSTLRLNLRRAFYQLLFAQKKIEVSQIIMKMRQDEGQLVSLRYDSGTEYKGNMQRAEAQLLQAKADLAQALRDLRIAQRAINQQLGLDDFTVIKVTSTLNIQEPGDLPKDEVSLLRNRPDIGLQGIVVRIAELNLKQAKSSTWPNLSASYSLSSQGQDEFSTGLAGSESAWGVSLSYPLFGSGPTATYYAIETAKNNLKKAKQDLRTAVQEAISDIETTWSDFAGAVDQAKVQAALLEAARTRNDEANIRYDSGLMTYDNWEIITSDRINQERQVIQAQLNALVAQAAWENALGKQLEE
ncbi:MAG: TolC family protein [Elusimicrobia bacterium]|nr:TolC family protein [Candidatus Liberimonas magnetica]